MRPPLTLGSPLAFSPMPEHDECAGSGSTDFGVFRLEGHDQRDERIPRSGTGFGRADGFFNGDSSKAARASNPIKTRKSQYTSFGVLAALAAMAGCGAGDGGGNTSSPSGTNQTDFNTPGDPRDSTPPDNNQYVLVLPKSRLDYGKIDVDEEGNIFIERISSDPEPTRPTPSAFRRSLYQFNEGDENGNSDNVELTNDEKLTEIIQNSETIEGPSDVQRGQVISLANQGVSLTEIVAVQFEGDEDEILYTPVALEKANIVGATDHDDILAGNNDDDNMRGLAGNDVLSGLNGDDVLYGDEGHDTINGGRGSDTIYGGAGTNWLHGESYQDTGSNEGDVDTVVVNGGFDEWDIIPYTDISEFELFIPEFFVTDEMIQGEQFDGVMVSGFALSNGEIHYALGFEQIRFVDGDDEQTIQVIRGGDGTAENDIIIGSLGETILYDNIFHEFHNGAADTMHGGDGDDYMWGLAGNDVLMGGNGNDTLHGGRGNDRIDGGDDEDMVQFSNSLKTNTHQISATMESGETVITVNSVSPRSIEYGGIPHDEGNDTLRNVEKIKFNHEIFDIVSGTNENDSNILGNEGDDLIFGFDGDDTIINSNGRDIIYGGAGVDTVVFSGAYDDYSFERIDIYNNDVSGLELRVVEDDGKVKTLHDVERLRFEGEEDEEFQNIDILSEFEMSKIYGGSGDDVIRGNDDGQGIIASSGNDIIHGGDGHDIIFGGKGDDVVNGGEGNDFLSGSPGFLPDLNETTYGTPRDETYSGRDTFNGGEGNDKIEGDDDIDTAIYAGSIGEFHFSAIRDDTARFTGVTQLGIIDMVKSGDDELDEGIDTVWDVEILRFDGASFNVIVGTETADEELNGTGSNDLIFGLGGEDVIDGGEGEDSVVFFGDMEEYEIVGSNLVRNEVNNEEITLTNIEILRFIPDVEYLDSKIQLYMDDGIDFEIGELTTIYLNDLFPADGGEGTEPGGPTPPPGAAAISSPEKGEIVAFSVKDDVLPIDPVNTALTDDCGAVCCDDCEPEPCVGCADCCYSFGFDF